MERRKRNESGESLMDTTIEPTSIPPITIQAPNPIINPNSNTHNPYKPNVNAAQATNSKLKMFNKNFNLFNVTQST